MIRNLLFTISILVLAFTGQVHSAEPIRIGTSQSLTGQYANFGTEQLRGLQMWVHDVNARGALLGRPVELVFYDDGSSDVTSAQLYRKLIKQDQVDLLVGPYSSDLTLAASNVAEQFQFPMLATAASADNIWARGYKNIIGLDTPSTRYMDLAIEVAASRGAKTLALVYADTQFGNEVVGGVRSKAREQGLRIVLDERYVQQQLDFSSLASRIGAANADLVLGVSYLDDSVALVRALKSANVKPDMLAFSVGPALFEFGQQLGADAEGVVGVVQWLRSAPVPGAQDFAYRYRRLYGNNPAVHAAIGYSAGEVLEAAVRLAGSTDQDAVRQQLLALEFGSLMGLYMVNETGRQLGKKNYLLQWQEGRRRLVKPATVAERKLIYPLP